jgi:hypothetical protein
MSYKRDYEKIKEKARERDERRIFKLNVCEENWREAI